MIVLEPLVDRFVATVTELMGRYVPGDPMDPETTLAPLSSEAAAKQLHEQITDAVEKGATLHTGGQRDGAYVHPTVLTGVVPGMRAYHEELFGPAITIFTAADEDDAIRIANDSPYGLGASVFTDDDERAERVAGELDVGMVNYNSIAGSQADLPFGGVKRSGIGRELGELGIEGFMNHKIIKLRP